MYKRSKTEHDSRDSMKNCVQITADRKSRLRERARDVHELHTAGPFWTVYYQLWILQNIVLRQEFLVVYAVGPQDLTPERKRN